MNGPLLLDTNSLIHFFGGNKRVEKLISESTRICIPAVVCGEMDAGTQGDTARERIQREAFAEILSRPNVSVIPVSRVTGSFYGKIYAFLRKTGKPIPINDIWIAAATMETAGVLCTGDKHLLDLPLIRTTGVQG